MADVLYREQILEHWKNPHNFGELSHSTHSAFEQNPLCGDEISIQLEIQKSVIRDLRFKGAGCAISIASTSLLTDFFIGKTVDEIRTLTEESVIQLLGITPSPSRMKCAVLGLRTMHKALSTSLS